MPLMRNVRQLIIINCQRNLSKTSFNLANNALSEPFYGRKSDPLYTSKGTGGRQSVSGNTVTVLGASGMVGKLLVNRLCKEGSQVVIGVRSGDRDDVRSLKVSADLGTLYYQDIDIRDPEKLRAAMQYSNIVINLIGADYETRNFSYEDVNVKGPRLIAKIARECNVQKLVHFSSLNASLNPQKIYLKPSKFLITKYLGEQAVREEYENAVIVRPANIYGENDRFLFYYANDLRRGLTGIPLWKKGEMTIKMPVHQINVVDGVMKILRNRDIKGLTYDFVGPDKYLLSEIVDYIYQRINRGNIKRTFMTPTRLGITYLTDVIMKRSIFNMDILEREFISDTLSGSKNPTLKDLGVEFKNFEQWVTWHLKLANKLAYYDEKLGEFKEPKAPKPLSDDFEYQLRRGINRSLSA